MIAKHSESYPYLEVAQRLGIDYGVVLNFASELDAYRNVHVDTLRPWQLHVWLAWEGEQFRRRNAAVR